MLHLFQFFFLTIGKNVYPAKVNIDVQASNINRNIKLLLYGCLEMICSGNTLREK